jgi:hypothetical protein
VENSEKIAKNDKKTGKIMFFYQFGWVGELTLIMNSITIGFELQKMSISCNFD